MSSTAFLKIEGIIGESTDSNHIGWIDVDRFEIDAAQPGSMHTGGGGGTAKVRYSDLTVFTHTDKATPTIFSYAASGRHIPNVTLAIHKAGGTQIEYLRISLQHAIVTYCGYNGSLSGSLIPVTYRFQASVIKHQYWEQTESGIRGAEVSSTFDIKQNKIV